MVRIGTNHSIVILYSQFKIQASIVWSERDSNGMKAPAAASLREQLFVDRFGWQY